MPHGISFVKPSIFDYNPIGKLEIKKDLSPNPNVINNVQDEYANDRINLIKRYLNDFIFQASVSNLVVISVAASVIFLYLVYVCYCRGRHSYPQLVSSLWKQPQSNPSECKNAKQLNEPGPVQANASRTEVNFPKPKEYDPDVISFPIWISLFESYADAFPKSVWRNLLVASINENLLKKLKINCDMDYNTIKQLVQSESIVSHMDHSRKVTMDDTVAAIYQLCDLKRDKHESVENFFYRFLVAAKQADISKEETLISFFLRSINSVRMVMFINQAIVLQKLISSSNFLEPAINLNMCVSFAKAYEQSKLMCHKVVECKQNLTCSRLSRQSNRMPINVENTNAEYGVLSREFDNPKCDKLEEAAQTGSSSVEIGNNRTECLELENVSNFKNDKETVETFYENLDVKAVENRDIKLSLDQGVRFLGQVAAKSTNARNQIKRLLDDLTLVEKDSFRSYMIPGTYSNNNRIPRFNETVKPVELHKKIRIKKPPDKFG